MEAGRGAVPPLRGQRSRDTLIRMQNSHVPVYRMCRGSCGWSKKESFMRKFVGFALVWSIALTRRRPRRSRCSCG
jgi:hypothetical protein